MGKGANGAVELAINLVTVALSAFVRRWTRGPSPCPGGPMRELRFDLGVLPAADRPG